MRLHEWLGWIFTAASKISSVGLFIVAWLQYRDNHKK